jgi:hypothetical protein
MPRSFSGNISTGLNGRAAFTTATVADKSIRYVLDEVIAEEKAMVYSIQCLLLALVHAICSLVASDCGVKKVSRPIFFATRAIER